MIFNKLDNLEVKGKTLILRLDLNMPVKAGKFIDLTRLIRSLPTINYFLEKKTKIVIISHMGRPGGKFVRSLSLAPLVDEIEKLLGQRVHFATDCVGDRVKNKIKSMKEGEVILLENVRFHVGEEMNDPELAYQMSSLGDIFVNDAFSCSHRSHASIEGITKFLPSFAGIALRLELENIERLLLNPQGIFSALVGGAKISSKLSFLLNLLDKVDHLVLGGGLANTCLHAMGYNVGSSLVDLDFMPQALDMLNEAQKKRAVILLPEDFVVKNFEGSISIKPLSRIEKDDIIMDIGPMSSTKITNIINLSSTLVWNGPFGVVENIQYMGCSSHVARSIVSDTYSNNLKSIIGGGDTAGVLQVLGLKNCVTYISTGGGAFLAWLEGKVLPGLKNLSSKHS